MVILSRTDNESSICDLVDECLEGFPLSTKLQMIHAKEHKGGISVGYSSVRNLIASQRTYFDIQIVGEECYILGFGVEKDRRGAGYGQELFRRIEDFCRKYGLRKLITTPSGQGVPFWKKMGFEKINEYEAAKEVT